MTFPRYLFGSGMDQDFVDSANGFWTVWLLSICSVSAFVIRYIMHPISCWTPAQFTGFHVDYVTRTCLQEGRFYLPFAEAIPIEATKRLSTFQSYYLWVPLFLALQAFGFKLPNVIWSACRHYLTFHIDETLATLKASQIYNQDNRTLIRNTAQVLREFLKRNKFFLSILYLVVKFLYCFNLAVQFIILTVYMKPVLPIQLLYHLPADVRSLVPYFAKTVLCEVSIHQMTNVRHYTVQCTLHITEVYEKMYVFLWFWLLLLIVITNLNLLVWLGHFFIPFLRDSRISVYIDSSSGPSTDPRDVNRFVNDVLGIDGVFLLTTISRNSSETIASDLVQEMFQDFQRNNPVDSNCCELQDQAMCSSSKREPPEIKVEMYPDIGTEKA